MATLAPEVLRRASWPAERAQPVEQATDRTWGLLPPLSLVAAGGVLLLAFADNAARRGEPHAAALYWLAIVVIVVPIAARLSRPECSRGERLGLVLVVGIAAYLLKLMTWPLGFAFHDDLGQLRTTLDIGSTHHLFSRNPIVGAYAYYPGLEEVTNALSSISGLGPTAAGFIVVGVARVILVLALFRLFEAASGSAHVAGIAVLLYAANPNFVYFDGQVAYESLALPLAAAALCAAAVCGLGRQSAPFLLVICLLVGGTVVSHHMSAYFLVAVLAAWLALDRWKRFAAPPRASLSVTAVAVLATGAWLFFAGPATEQELGSIPRSAAVSIWDLALGKSPPRQLFHAANGTAEPLLTQWIGYASVLLVLVLLPFGILRAVRRGNAISLVLLGVAALYPPSLVLRLTSAGTETSSRAAEYVFVGAAYVIALFVAGRLSARPAVYRFGPGRAYRIGGASKLLTPLFALYAGVVFAGGLIIGWSPSARLPGPFEVGSPPRSISFEGVETAKWVGSAFSANHILVADSTNALLLASYGRQAPTSHPVTGLALLRLYEDPALTQVDRQALGDVDYLVTDRRLTRALPLNGGYFGADDYTVGLTHPLPAAGLRKFDETPGVARVYDSGNIAVYATRGT